MNHSGKGPKKVIIIGVLVGVGVLTLALAFSVFAFSYTSKTLHPNPVQLENAKAGTSGWKISKPSQQGEIQAYAGEDSIDIGQSVHLYVSTMAPSYRVDIYRLGYYQGIGARLVDSIPMTTGLAQGYYLGPKIGHPQHCPTCILSYRDVKGQETHLTDANWKLTNTIAFSRDWISGLYYIKLTESRTDTQWSVTVVVRDDARKAALIFQDPVNTDQAYNEWGGTSLYFNYRTFGPLGYPKRGMQGSLDDGTTSGRPVPYWAFYVSFNRPYSQPSGTGSGFLFRWTYPLVEFLEQQGYDVTYTTNNGVARGNTRLENYKGFISAGHDEYWSYAERTKLEAAIAAGVNVAFFGANNIYWQIRNAPDLENHSDRFMICYKDYSNSKYPDPYTDPYDTPSNPNNSLTTTQWRANPVNDPEDKLLKAMYPIGGASGIYQDFVVNNTSSWVFTGTGLHDGDSIKGILGYEIDTVFPADGSITPKDHITIVGSSPFNRGEFTATALLDELKGGNIIFDAGTIYWPDGLEITNPNIPVSNALRQMTSNILDRMEVGLSHQSLLPS